MSSATKGLSKKISFRMTEEESERLSQTAKILGCRPSDALRIALTTVNMAAEELTVS